MTSESRSARLAALTADDAELGVIDRFARVLTALADDVAVTDDDGDMTYADLATRAAAVRVALADGTGPVAVLVSHRREAVVAILGTLASGRELLVLDARTPVPRLADLAGRVDVATVLTESALRDEAAQLSPSALVLDDLPAAKGEDLFVDTPAPQDQTVLAFTSGSTGRPKVVVNDGRMLVSDAWRNSAASGCYGADDVIAHTLPMAFHAGLMVTVAGLLVGSTMRLFDTRAHGIGGLAAWLAEVEATIVHTSPAILRAFVSAAPTPEQLRTLRSVTIAGEPAHGRDVEKIRPLLPPGCLLRNRYGSSETGLIAEYVVDSAHPVLAGPLPVGAGVGETEMRCLSEDGTPLPDGEVGIVSITRDHVAAGYRDDTAATLAAFSVEPDGRRTYRTSDIGRLENGCLTLVGRRDHSVKVRGYLVEPGDVDAALFTLPDVTEALTVGVKREEDDRYRLVSYVVSSAEQPSTSGIRVALREILPGHLVPDVVVFLPALPRTDRGKLDRAALPPPPRDEVHEPPASEWERLVAGVWASVLDLDLEQVGRTSDFFALGGDSLAAEELSTRVVTDLGIDAGDVTAAMIAQAPTLADYARRVKRKPDRRTQIVTKLADGSPERRPLFIVAGGGGLGVGFVPLVRHLPADLPVWAFHSYGIELKGIPDWSIPAAARRNLRELRRLAPQGPYRLAGHSFGGLVALEMAQQLRAAGEKVEVLVELDSFPPDPLLIPPAPGGRSVGRKLRDLVGLAVTGLVPHPGLGQYWRFHAQSRVLSTWYRTAPYPGRTVVLVADSEDREARSSWAPHLSGDWTMHTIDGDHLTMLRDPHASSLAARLTEVLDDIDGVTPASTDRSTDLVGVSQPTDQDPAGRPSPLAG
ncbi:MAG: AMP-binding protein [Mobilicoccus sp.]|nr:AMP-binding protein [Mobilicoccus sp.]